MQRQGTVRAIKSARHVNLKMKPYQTEASDNKTKAFLILCPGAGNQPDIDNAGGGAVSDCRLKEIEPKLLDKPSAE